MMYMIKASNCYSSMVGIPADQNSPKWRSKGNIWNLAYWISDSLLYWDIYLIHIYHMSKCSKCNWNRYNGWRILYVKCTFSHKWVIPKYCLCYLKSYLNELTFNGNLFSFIELSWLLTIFCAVFISYLMVINSKKYKSKYPTTIWLIMPCIMSELWKNK